MRLPTATPRQKQFEDLRQIHEQLWADFTNGNHGLTLTMAEHGPPEVFTGGSRKFWASRGYVIHGTRLNENEFRVTLTVRA